MARYGRVTDPTLGAVHRADQQQNTRFVRTVWGKPRKLLGRSFVSETKAVDGKTNGDAEVGFRKTRTSELLVCYFSPFHCARIFPTTNVPFRRNI